MSIGITRRDLAFGLSVSLVMTGLAWALLSVARLYPHYFMWDMDLTVTLDSLLIHSGLMPDHINHTSFGMYLLLRITQSVARTFDVISALTLGDLSASLNPISGVVELTDFIRLHSPVIALAMVAMLWAALCILFRPSRVAGVLVLAVLASQASLLHHATMIRSEFYAIFFWAGAVLMLAIALRASRPAATTLALLAAGVLLGLCFQTKIQAVFLVAVFPVLLLLGITLASGACLEALEPGAERRRARRSLCAGAVNAIAFPLLLIAAGRTTLPEKMGVFEYYDRAAGHTGLAPYALLLGVVLVAIFAIQLLLVRRPSRDTSLFRFLGLLSWLALGFHLSLLLHFLIFSDPGQSLRYLLYDVVLLFFRGTYREVPGLGELLESAWTIVRFQPVVFLAHFALLGLLLLGRQRGWIRLTLGQLALLLAASGFAVLQVVFGTRPLLRDQIFVEVLFDTLTILFAMVIADRAVRRSPSLRRVAGGILIGVVASNLVHASRIVGELDAERSDYGWRENLWFAAVYPGNQKQYSKLMHRAYPPRSPQRQLAGRVARDHRKIRRTVGFVFGNQTVTHRNIGVLAPGFPVWAEDRDWRLSELPPGLDGSIVVDNARIPTRAHGGFAPDDVNQLTHAGGLPPDHIAVLGRRDLGVYLFVEPDDLPAIQGSTLRPVPGARIELQRGEETLELIGLRVIDYTEVESDRLRGRYFFVIQSS